MLPAPCIVVFLTVCVGLVQTATRVNARQQLQQHFEKHRIKRSIGHVGPDVHRGVREVFALGEGETFRVTEEATTVQGERQFKLKEQYNGQNVLGASVTVTMDGTGERIHDASGDYIQNIHKDMTQDEANINEDALYEIIINLAKDRDRVADISDRSIVYDVYADDEGVAHPAAVVQYLIETGEVQKRPTAVINTKTGDVISYFDSLETCFDDVESIGGNNKMGRILYGSEGKCLDMRKEDGICYLENEYVTVINMNSSARETSTGTARFNCSEGLDDEINGAFSPALDALYYGTQIGKMFDEWFNTEPINGGLVLRVHFARNIMNAFWNGHNITFGDGRKRIIYPLVCMDITAHEIAHGFTEQHSGLIYIGQAGGLNEAFADMTGEMAEAYIRTADWEVGADIMYRKPMRYFDDPERDGRSISHVSKYSNRMSPHMTSGIYNKVFYLLAHEYGLDFKEVYRVFLHANKMYWQPLTNFKSGACDVMQAAYDVGQPGEPFARAFEAVGIDVCDVDDHLVALEHNTTVSGVSVSNVTRTAFSIDVPDWRQNLIITASAENGVDITIKVYSGRWVKINDTTMPLVQGVNQIDHDIKGVESQSFIVTLSSEDNLVPNIQLTGGYSCDMSYTNRHPLYRKYFMGDCMGLRL